MSTRRIAIDMTPFRSDPVSFKRDHIAIGIAKLLRNELERCEIFILVGRERKTKIRKWLGAGYRYVVAHRSIPDQFNDKPKRRRICEALRKITLPFRYFGLQNRTSHFLLTRLKIRALLSPYGSDEFMEPGIALLSVHHDLYTQLYSHMYSPETVVENFHHARNLVQISSLNICGDNRLRHRLSLWCNADYRKTAVCPPLGPIEAPWAQGRRSPSPPQKPGSDFLLYPSDFTPGANHALLLVAFGMYLSSCEQNGIKLVLCGQKNETSERLKGQAKKMGLDGDVSIIENPDPSLIRQLYRDCAGFVFPFLFDEYALELQGAVLPDKIIICSKSAFRIPSGNPNLLLVDPRKPTEIAASIRKAAEMIQRRPDPGEKENPGTNKLKKSMGSRNFISAISRALDQPRKSVPWIKGLHWDSWTAPRVTVMHNGLSADFIELTLENPSHLDRDTVNLYFLFPFKKGWKITLLKGERRTVKIPIEKKNQKISIEIFPSFSPSRLEPSADHRRLGVFCPQIRIGNHR